LRILASFAGVAFAAALRYSHSQGDGVPPFPTAGSLEPDDDA
jgi:hypothetical protein